MPAGHRLPPRHLHAMEQRIMSTIDFSGLVAAQRAYFRTGITRDPEWRISQLAALRAMVTDRAEEFYAALWTDLHRNRVDADLTDVEFIAKEADHARAHLHKWMAPVRGATPLMFPPSRPELPLH